MHLAAAIPKEGQEQIRALAADLQKLPLKAADRRLLVQRRVFAEMEAWLDRAARGQYLREPDVAKEGIEAIRFREGRDWRMFEFVLMPNHLHLFFELLHEGLKSVSQQFKRWTGHAAGRLIGADGDRFWQDEWFDHWSRSDEEDEKIAQYIRRNPVKAGLVSDYTGWPFGSWNL